MHNNYFVLKRLASVLQQDLNGSVVSECFSQSKDELVIRFETKEGSRFIKASLLPGLQCLSFPKEYHRARKNSVDLFPEWIGAAVEEVRVFDNERSLQIRLQGDRSILFKMHSVRSNVLSVQGDTVVSTFRKSILQDLKTEPLSLNRHIDWSFESFKQYQGKLQDLYFTFGKPVWSYLDANGFHTLATLEQQWNLLQEVRQKLDANPFSIVLREGVLALTLLPTTPALRTFSDPREALTVFSSLYAQALSLKQLKEKAIHRLEQQLSQSRSYIRGSEEKVSQLKNDAHYRLWADLIMANLTSIPQNATTFTTSDFVSGAPVTIPLKPNHTPQKLAEVYYRKAKNQSIEIDHLLQRIAGKQKEEVQLLAALDAVRNSEDSKRILSETKSVDTAKDRHEKATLPYREEEYKGFRIWIGKHAAANDELTLKHSHKEDLWLHAKDVAGSHVLIKHQAGKPYPKDVIERAAELAAHFSKRKTDSLCPVAYTTKKYVRKPKGAPAGSVIVEKEKVILVEPRGPGEPTSLR